jgi:hypothetical protein
MDFLILVDHLQQFRMNCTPSRESEIEGALVSFLKSRGIPVRQQFTIKNGRLDIMIGQYIIEVKHTGQRSIADQLDRYSGHCEGLIVVCWKASGPLKSLFSEEKKTARIPIELIEVRKACGMI